MLSCFSSLLIKSSTAAPSWMAILIAFSLLFSSYLLVLISFGYFSILYTSLVLLFSSALTLLLSRHKPVAVDEKVLSPPSQQEILDQRENIALLPTPLTVEAKEAQEDANSRDAQEQLSTCEGSEEVDWSVQFGECCSDGSISDEDSLIEIALPSGHYLGHHHHCSLQQKKRELSAAEALFSHHQSLMEFLSELNNDVSEEENLIEIDISMGSIKYSSRFEIKA